MPKPFPEAGTHTDIELDSLVVTLRLEIKKRGYLAGLVQISRYCWPNEPGSWQATACLVGRENAITASGTLLHEAFNALLEKIGERPDLAAVLGYQDQPLQGPLERDDVPGQEREDD